MYVVVYGHYYSDLSGEPFRAYKTIARVVGPFATRELAASYIDTHPLGYDSVGVVPIEAQ